MARKIQERGRLKEEVREKYSKSEKTIKEVQKSSSTGDKKNIKIRQKKMIPKRGKTRGREAHQKQRPKSKDRGRGKYCG